MVFLDGGFLGVYAISMSIYTAPKLGFFTFSGLVIFGQIAISMLLDHFGWLGTESTCQLAAFTRWYHYFYWCFTHFTTFLRF
jgi:uncharacterized membrane protein YdcZ (DUF606 family)